MIEDHHKKQVIHHTKLYVAIAIFVLLLSGLSATLLVEKLPSEVPAPFNQITGNTLSTYATKQIEAPKYSWLTVLVGVGLIGAYVVLHKMHKI